MSDSGPREPAHGAADRDSDDAVGRSGAGEYLVIRLSGREYALPAEAVRGMVELRAVAPWILGGRAGGGRTALVEGRTLPVIPVHALLGIRERPFSARTCLVLLAHPPASRQPTCALVADSVSRIERVPARRQRDESGQEWVEAQIMLGEKWRGVLDLNRLAAAQGLRAA
ncbi:MAG TPA: chemotaxis protein CheW [Bryobacteraceae bacterium]|nr:chemotaxis protein CheW [Bryobacteraceae bacterium]